MDLIGSVKRIESKLGKHDPDRTWRKPAIQNKHNDAQGTPPLPDQNQFSAFEEIQPGRNIDTTA